MWLNNYIVCINYLLFIHSSFDGHLCSFYILTFVNNASMNIGVQVSESLLLILWGIYVGVKLLDYNSKYFPQWLHHFTVTQTMLRAIFLRNIFHLVWCWYIDTFGFSRYMIMPSTSNKFLLFAFQTLYLLFFFCCYID